MRELERRTVAVLVAATIGVLALLAFATAGGGPAEFGAPRVSAEWAQGPARDLAEALQPQEREPEPEQLRRPDETPWALIVTGVVGTVLAALMLRTPRVRGGGVRAGDVAPHEPPDLDDGGAEAVAALRRAARSSATRLRGTDARQARDAVVAAWQELEEAAAISGVPRGPAQTPTEFTVDLLAAHSADPNATAELLHLYHRARFGSAEPAADAGERAADALAVIAAGLRKAQRA